MISGKPYTSRGVRAVWEGVDASPFRRMSWSLPHDTTLFLGGKEKTTLKEISEILGKETIDSFNTSENRGRELSHGLNYQKLGKELMSQDEIAVMDGGKCILQLRGVRPFFSEKYDITKHPNYKYLSDYDKKNTFDMEKHLRRRPAIVKPDEVFDYYEVDAAELE